MSEKAVQSSNVPALTTEGRQAAIEAILNHRFPLRSLYQSLQLLPKILAGSKPELAAALKDVPVPDYIQQVETKRAELLDLQEPQLLALYQEAQNAKRAQEARWAAERQAKKDAKAAAKAADRFYNRPNASADLAYWAKMEYWSFEESIALLLGKNPKVVTWKAVREEIDPSSSLSPPEPSAFLENYVRLWELGRRASVMRPPQLKPAEVVAWARVADVAPIPVELDKAFPAAAAVQTAPSPLQTESAEPELTATPGTGKRWDDTARRELQEYREKHGTKAAAERYGITTARVRQLLPQTRANPTANDPFGRTAKRR